MDVHKKIVVVCLMGHAVRAVGILKEYRTRLVADVVTGKLDVREAAARLPAEPEAEAAEPDEDLGLPLAAEEEGSYVESGGDSGG